jgi:hypothetical protein
VKAKASASVAMRGGLYFAAPFSRRRFHTFSGVIGMSMYRTPRCDSALTITGGAPTVAETWGRAAGAKG